MFLTSGLATCHRRFQKSTSSLTCARNLSSLRKWPSEPSEWKRRNKSQSRLPTATPTVDTPDRHGYAAAS
eukprot:scaffold282588_cov46-Attheya_sp.AAC.2